VLDSFRHAHVLPRSAKALGWVCVVILNIFFVYFSILRAYERGYAWQRMFALACLVQFLVEVIIYETTECAMVHFLIPNLVRTEVQTAGVALRNIVTQLCTSQALGPSSSSSSNVVLDAPHYLFVSVNVAEKYPDMLESVLIRSYHTCWPGSYATKWRFDHFSGATGLLLSGGGGSSTGFLRSVSVTVILVSLLKEFGASSPVIQRLLLHSLQPLLVAAIFFVGSIFFLRPLYWLTFIPVVAYGVYSYRKYQWEVSQDNASGAEGDIHPIEEEMASERKTEAAPKGPAAASQMKLQTIEEQEHESTLREQDQGSPAPSSHPSSNLCMAPPEGAVFDSAESSDGLQFELGVSDDLSSDSIWELRAGTADEDESPTHSRRRRFSSDSFLSAHNAMGRVRASSLYSSNGRDTSQDDDEDREEEDAYSGSSLDDDDEEGSDLSSSLGA
jgi:hypothetical protein